MRIGLDVSLVPGQRVGGGQYAYQLASALARVDQENSYLLYAVFYYIAHPDHRRAALPMAPNVRVALRGLPPKAVPFLWRTLRSDRLKEFLLGDADIVHSMTYCAPRLRRRRLVVTIYDLTFVTHPEYHLPANVEHCLTGTRRAIERADALVTISEASRHDLLEHFKVDDDRIVVTHLAADPAVTRVTDALRREAVRRRYGLPERFVLFLGALEPRKNLVRLLEAFAALAPPVRQEFALVVAGAQGWLNHDVRERIEKLGVQDRVHLVGYVAPQDLAALYSLATVLAYPSLSEGFGLPVLEAMACGTPVLTSNAPALREVAGDAALLVPPSDVDAIASGLTRLLEDAPLRAELQARGARRAPLFSWDRCARETLAVYRRVAGR